MDQMLGQYLTRFVPAVPLKSAAAVLELTAEGGTVPFIARYRKEKTGNLDEVQIRAVIEANETYQEIVKRKAFLVKEIGEQKNLTPELEKRIGLSWDLNELEEIYKPFKKKKKTKATVARDAGLEPLANWIWDMGHGTAKDATTMEVKAKSFLNPDAKIVTYDDALKGAQDIIVEKIANEASLREKVVQNYFEKGKVSAKAAKGLKPNSKYEMYTKDYSDSVKNLLEEKASHRYMAMKRGWEEEELTVEITAEDDILLMMYEKFATTTPENAIGTYLKESARLAMNVYVVPSVKNEVHAKLKEKSDEHAIKVFSENVRRVLLGSPFGPRCVLGVDPGLRTGCKVALVDKGGNYVSHTVMYTLGDNAEQMAKTLVNEVTKQIKIEAIAVGNGTAGRETEIFLKKVLKDIGKAEIPVVMVNESGASVYSASEVARAEFPDLDVTVKGAISIARRLQDPLAELVKIDPKSIGVGQYQHDVNQSQLKKGLEAVVESCVNNVGVDVNTASSSLLSHVSGIGPGLAQAIVDHRKKNGLFTDRSELNKVPRFTAKVFEQAAGFLRILNGKVFLDSTGIHPERYGAVRDMATDLNVNINELVGEGAKQLVASRTKWAKIVGEFTFDDIYKELEKPGRDPRDPYKVFQFKEDIFEVKDLKEGMICPGIVTNVTNFGAFVDIGVHQDGLVHISELAHKFVEDPRKVVNPGDQVTVKVLKIDLAKNQVALTMKLEAAPEHKSFRDMKEGNAQGARPQGGNRPQGDRSPRPQGDRGPRPQGGGFGGGQNRDQGPRNGGFTNNPFAALLTNKK
ncbi:helix-hairpin-helix domain-containing protein [Pseudobdellovibrio sp. HCB154]|uniref:helix-hairpin-helix domain-containing protein n=1 Tax=Pseudobdellovibrio sp. HCB154 TaxID=3386277 RepID=UPI0039175BE0